MIVNIIYKNVCQYRLIKISQYFSHFKNVINGLFKKQTICLSLKCIFKQAFKWTESEG